MSNKILYSLILLSIFIITCNRAKESLPKDKTDFDKFGYIQSHEIKYNDSIKIMKKIGKGRFQGIVFNNFDQVLNEGFYSLKDSSKGKLKFYADGWYTKYDNNQRLKYRAELISFDDSIYTSQIKAFNSDGSINANKSIYYQLTLDSLNSNKNKKLTGKISLMYKSKNVKNLDAQLILTDELKPDFSNLNEIRGVKNIYNVKPINKTSWTFDLLLKDEEIHNLRGFIYFTDHYFEPSSADSTLFDAILLEKYIFINEKIDPNK